MSSISVLQAPGSGQVTSVATPNNVSSPAPSTPSAGNAAATADSVSLFHSPRLEIDPLLNQVIIEYRDEQSGLAQYQVPSKSQLLAYQATQPQASTSTSTEPFPVSATAA
jgi:hypothetical protein